MGSSVPIPKDLVDLVEGGVSIMMGTRDDRLVPEATKAVGAAVSADRTRLTVFVPTRAGSRALANLAANPLVAVAFSRVLDHVTVQVKGTAVEVRPATEAERKVPERYVIAYGEVLHTIGIPRRVMSRLEAWPAHAVVVDVHDLFAQTPGPGAGKRLGS